jgi:ribonuclease III
MPPKDIEKLQEKLDLTFNDTKLLERALTHRSYLNEAADNDLKNNERLEYLGDAVLELVVTEYLFLNYPTKTEGELTSFRSATVKTDSLAETASKLDLGSYIFMSKGEERTGGRTRPYILANTFEALLGAIYLDKGLEGSFRFLEKHLLPKIKVIIENRLDIDSKSSLQEISQQELSLTPSYEVKSEEGPDHAKTFTMAVKIGNHEFGVGEGRNKQEAEQEAAKNALKDWDQLTKKYF